MTHAVSFPAADVADAERICAENGLTFVRAMPMSPHDHRPNHNGHTHGGAWACFARYDPDDLVAKHAVSEKIEGLVDHGISS